MATANTKTVMIANTQECMNHFGWFMNVSYIHVDGLVSEEDGQG